MWKKKFFLLVASGIVFSMVMTLPVSAHGGRHHHKQSGQKESISCEVCPVEDCTTPGRHTHNGITYCGYAHDSGICDGSCIALCEDADCTVSGRHTHNGVAYCGYAHENGFCNGSCVAGNHCHS